MSPDDEQQVRTLTQQAVDATATAYTRDASTDIQRYLRTELERAGLVLDDDEWIAEVVHMIRSGHHVNFAEPEAPGSLGGDNGGG